MKPLYQIIVITLIFCYLVIAFIKMEFNPSLWSEYVRFTFVIFSLGGVICLSGIYYKLK